MPHGVELEVRHVHLATEPTSFADVVVSDRTSAAERGLRVRVSYGDGHQLAHELQGQETPRSHSVAVMGEVLKTLGGRVSLARLRADGEGRICAALQVEMPDGHMDVVVSPGHALAVTVRLGVTLLGDETLFDPDTRRQVPVAADSITEFLRSLDLSGLESRPKSSS
jgi:bifunctional DNase/RNase